MIPAREFWNFCGCSKTIQPPRIDTLLKIAEALECELIVDLKPR